MASRIHQKKKMIQVFVYGIHQPVFVSLKNDVFFKSGFSVVSFDFYFKI